MSRYINADKIPRHGQRGGIVHWKDIEDAPSIDIVRCKECKHYDDEDYGEPTRYCTWHESVVGADDFCSYGERREP